MKKAQMILRIHCPNSNKDSKGGTNTETRVIFSACAAPSIDLESN